MLRVYNAEDRLCREVHDWSANTRIAIQSDVNSVNVTCCAIVWATIPSPSLLRGDGVRSVSVLDRSYRNGRARASRLLVSTGWSPASATEDNIHREDWRRMRNGNQGRRQPQHPYR